MWFHFLSFIPCCSCSVTMSNSWRLHGPQHTMLLCPSVSPGIWSNSCPLSQWCYLTTSSSATPFSFCLQSFPASGSFPMSQQLCFRWPKYWSFSFSMNPSNEYSGLISFRMDCFDLLEVQGTLKSSLAPQFKSINSSVLNLLYGPTFTSIHDYWKNHSFD